MSKFPRSRTKIGRGGLRQAFDEAQPASWQVESITRALRDIVTWDKQTEPVTDWKAFEPYSAEAVTGQLAAAFDQCCPPS